MEHDFIDRYSRIDSFMSRLDPRVKIVGLAALMVCIVSTGPTALPAFAVYGAILLVLTRLSGIPAAVILKRMLVAVPFILMIVLFIPFFRGETVVLSLTFGPVTFSVTREGLILFQGVCVKAFLSLLSVILLTATTDFPTLLKALEKLGCPKVLVMVLSFMYRYIFVVQDEFMMMRQAKDARSVGGSRLFHWRALAGMVGVLFIRSYERAEAVYLAMCSRGFDGNVRTFHPFRVTAADAAFFLTLTVSLSCVKVLGALYG